ncbi:hypothetical protein BDD12DRAFT_855021 [Trichophaea hybrida]|nr:hypothetical protein BDD12DRAFT_855021 [Trichophaea hybrida]
MASQPKPRKRDRLSGIFRSGRAPHSSALEPTLVSGSPSTSLISVEKLQNATSPVASPSPSSAPEPALGPPSLWEKAIGQLTPQQRQTLAYLGIESGAEDVASNLDVIRNEMERMLEGYQEQSWQFNFRGENIVMRDVGRKILHWVDKFKEIGDIIIQYDPVHLALPWAAFRVLLKVCKSKQETTDAILVGLEKIACLIDRCTIYELLYIDKPVEASSSRNLEKSIIRLYTAILRFLTEAINRANDNAIQAAFSTDEILKYIADVEDLETTVGQDANASNLESTRADFGQLRTMLESVSAQTSRFGPQLDDIHILLEEQQKSKILAWISTIPYTSHHRDISERRLDETGNWLFEKEEYRRWKSSSASTLLLLRGIPGSGKTC